MIEIVVETAADGVSDITLRVPAQWAEDREQAIKQMNLMTEAYDTCKQAAGRRNYRSHFTMESR